MPEDIGNAIGSALTSGLNSYIGMTTMLNKKEYQEKQIEQEKAVAERKALAEKAAASSMLDNAVATGLIDEGLASKLRGSGVNGSDLLAQYSLLAPFVSKDSTARATADSMPELGMDTSKFGFGVDVNPRISGFSSQIAEKNNIRSNDTQMATAGMANARQAAGDSAAMTRALLDAGRPIVSGSNLITPSYDRSTGKMSYSTEQLPVPQVREDPLLQAKTLTSGALSKLNSINAVMSKPEFAAMEDGPRKAIEQDAIAARRQFDVGLQMMGATSREQMDELFAKAMGTSQSAEPTPVQAPAQTMKKGPVPLGSDVAQQLGMSAAQVGEINSRLSEGQSLPLTKGNTTIYVRKQGGQLLISQ